MSNRIHTKKSNSVFYNFLSLSIVLFTIFSCTENTSLNEAIPLASEDVNTETRANQCDDFGITQNDVTYISQKIGEFI
jgi:hypothetical protein